ncbi:hypothetical protein O181_109464 [Austropuccinia psidii MF-1]|uniref:Uncharacterized protein n=1 Tax=Austropuccinia psidii MF-1 TaxID=1389203 RepID=A0A9Q3PPX8_9BASI|nr:hypothetical protein [Austropuccinia psidii MF-1]
MASPGHFNPSQTYDGYKAVEVLDPACTECLAMVTGSRKRDVARWTNFRGALPVGGRPIYSSSEVPISRINNEEVVKQIRRIANSPPNPAAEGSEEAEVFPISAGHPVNYSPSHPPAQRLQSHIIHNTPRNFQTTLATIPTSIPPASPNPSHIRPALNQAVRPSPIPQPRKSPMVTSQQPQPVSSTSRRREELCPLPFPAAQVFQRQELFRRVVRNSRELIMYANDRNTPGTASEEMAANFAWYEDEMTNDFQRAFDDLGRDN